MIQSVTNENRYAIEYGIEYGGVASELLSPKLRW